MTDTQKTQAVSEQRHQSGIAAWSVRHPVGVSMIALAVIVLGSFSLARLSIDLLPHIIYPEIRVRILDPGVTASVMEDKVTRQLEEQLAITENAVQVQSQTSMGNTSVDLAFQFGTDIDIALRDASTRLDRAKRFLPESINPPIIFKFDPSQIPVTEFVVTSPLWSPLELRDWADHKMRNWFVNLPGVAAVEVGGGQLREIHILPDQYRLQAVGLTLEDVISAVQNHNVDEPVGRLSVPGRELSGQISNRFSSVAEIGQVRVNTRQNTQATPIYLHEVATVIDTADQERIRIRANGISGVKISIQKQPAANTVDVVEAVLQQLRWLKQQNLLPEAVQLIPVSDQSVYIRQSLQNSTKAAISGALLAMAVVYFFLGNIRRTLIIGSAIPIAIMVTFVLMGAGGLTLNIMTLGGLALGIGMLVDNTIVMMENIYRHQTEGEAPSVAAQSASTEVSSAIIASTTTNLAAVLPFLFVSGLTGLLFRELIFTISAAILASLVIAITLVPALAAKVPAHNPGSTASNHPGQSIRQAILHFTTFLQHIYVATLENCLRVRVVIVLLFLAGLGLSLHFMMQKSQIFLPKFDDGLITVRVTGDPGAPVEQLDEQIRRLEDLIQADPHVEMVYSLVGGSVFGRSQREVSNRASMVIQLTPLGERVMSSGQWMGRMQQQVTSLALAGIKIRMFQRGIRGLRTGSHDDDVSIRIQGDDFSSLEQIAEQLASALRNFPWVTNVRHSLEEETTEIHFTIDRARLSDLGLRVADVKRTLSVALEGETISSFIESDREHDIVLRFPAANQHTLEYLNGLFVYSNNSNLVVPLAEVVSFTLRKAPVSILRDNQMRIAEVSASLKEGASESHTGEQIDQLIANTALPSGFSLYNGGSQEALHSAVNTTRTLLALALFLVFVVMAVQYEALLNPLVILLSVPFAIIGVSTGLALMDMPVSMPVWLGLIMLAGIVVNNAIVFVEYIELQRDKGLSKVSAILEAGRLRLRPILMTTLTTVIGMLPLAIGTGEGSEMLQPLAISIVSGLSFSLFVSLILIPVMYDLLHIARR